MSADPAAPVSAPPAPGPGGRKVLVIDLNPRWAKCHACGEETPANWGLAVDECGDYVANDYAGEWGSVPACQRCHDFHAAHGPAALEAMLDRLRAALAARPAGES